MTDRSRRASRLTSVVLGFAAAFASGCLASALRAQAPATSAAATTARGAGSRMTIAGCVLPEIDFARTAGLGRAPAPADSTTGQFVLEIGTSRVAYSLTGPRERELSQRINQEVEITGTVEPSARGTVGLPAGALTPGGETREGTARLPAPGTAGVTPAGSPAHEPGDATGVTPGDSVQDAGSQAEAVPVSIGDLPRLRIESIRVTGGRCGVATAGAPSHATPATAPGVSDRTSTDVVSKRADLAQPTEVAAIGCLDREAGTANIARTGSDGTGALVLTRAIVDVDPRTASASAVPGSVPAGSGSGTVAPRPAATNGTAAHERAFRIASAPPELMKHVGQRVRITGTVPATPPSASRGDQSGRAANGHASAPSEDLTVTSFAAIGGTCG